MNENRTPSREQVLDAIRHASDKATVREAQRLVRRWMEDNPDDVEILQASSSLTVAATALLSGTVPPYYSTASEQTAGQSTPQSASPSPLDAADGTQATPNSDAPEADAPEADMTLRLIAHLEKENAFLRAQVEEANRNAAELRAALREAQRLHGRALSSPDDNAA